MLCHFKTFSVASKWCCLLVLACLVCSVFAAVPICMVNAQAVIIDENVEGAKGLVYLSDVYPTGSSSYSAISQQFTGTGIPVTEAQFYITRSNPIGQDPIVQLTANIYAASSNTPTGSSLASSDVVLFTDLTINSPAWHTFIFSGSNIFTPKDGVTYCIVLQVNSDGLSGANNLPPNVQVYLGNLNNPRGSAYAWRSGYGWTTVSATNHALNFRVIGGTVSSYAVSYDANWPSGSVGLGTVPPVQLAYSGVGVNVSANVGGLSLSGYEFLGWAFTSNAVSPDFVVAGSTVVPSNFTMPPSDVVLFAVWLPVVSPSVSPSPSLPESVPVQGGVLFAVFFFVVVLLVWLLALYRGSVGFYALSAVCWLSFCGLVFYVGEASDPVVVSLALIGLVIGAVMLMQTGFLALKYSQKSRGMFDEQENGGF